MTARLLGAIHLVDQTVQRLYPIERDDFSHLVDATCLHLGASHFDSAWGGGYELDFDRAVEDAVTILEAALPAQATPSRVRRSLL